MMKMIIFHNNVCLQYNKINCRNVFIARYFELNMEARESVECNKWNLNWRSAIVLNFRWCWLLFTELNKPAI